MLTGICKKEVTLISALYLIISNKIHLLAKYVMVISEKASL